MSKTKDHIPVFPKKLPHTEYWENSREMNRAIHNFPGMFRALFLELMKGHMHKHEIRDFLNRIARGDRRKKRLAKVQLHLETHLGKAQELNIIEEKDGNYCLTPAGEEIAEYMQLVIPAFMKWVFSPKTVSLFSLGAHVVLSLVKLGTGLFTSSAGLFADGIDNTVDTLSSLLVWLGIKYEKEKLVSMFIIATMYISILGIAFVIVNKVIRFEPVKNELTGLSVSLVCGLIMLGSPPINTWLVKKHRISQLCASP